MRESNGATTPKYNYIGELQHAPDSFVTPDRTTEPPHGDVYKEIDEQRISINDLHQVTMALEKALAPVTVTSPPESDEDLPAITAATFLGRDIATNTSEIISVIKRLGRLLSRISL